MNTDEHRSRKTSTPGKLTPQSVTHPTSAGTAFPPAYVCVHLCSSVMELNQGCLAWPIRRSAAGALLWVLVLILAAPAAESAIFSTIITNGPTTNRVNLVIFSEGYTNGQLAVFLNDATNAADFFLNAEPYAEYSNYFNVFAIFTNSAHSGSTHLNVQTYSSGYTYFNSTYAAASDYIITIPPNPSDSANSHGQGKIDSLLQTYLPATNNDLAALLVNDGVPGGSDNYGNTAITSIPNVS